MPKVVRKVEKPHDFKKLRYLLGGDDCLTVHPTRRPESFLAYMDTFHHQENRNHHIMSTCAPSLPKAISDAVKLKDSLTLSQQRTIPKTLPRVNIDLLNMKKGLIKGDYQEVLLKADHRFRSVRKVAVASS